MAVNLDNLDDVIKQMAKMEKSVDMDVIRLVRRKFNAALNKLKPEVRKITPKKTGTMKKSLIVKSRTRRGLTKVRLIYNIVKPKEEQEADKAKEKPKKRSLFKKVDKNKKKEKLVNYSGVVNFKKGQAGYKFAYDYWQRKKVTLDKQGEEIIREAFETILKKHGVKVVKE